MGYRISFIGAACELCIARGHILILFTDTKLKNTDANNTSLWWTRCTDDPFGAFPAPSQSTAASGVCVCVCVCVCVSL